MVVCKRCVMDSSAMEFKESESGCNFCDPFILASADLSHSSSNKLVPLVQRIKQDGLGKEYDCIVGVSGGVDSSWVLVKAVELGLRPLAVHMDNTWNSELANNNIRNLVDGLGVDLETYVIDWQEYRAMLRAFLKADVIDIELLYDNALYGVNYQLSKKYGIKHLLGGMNHATEGIPLPKGWNWNKYDTRNIKAIYKTYGEEIRIKSYPYFSIVDHIFHKYIRKTEWHSILDMLPFKKEIAMQSLEVNFGYKRYPYKHYESILTRFYQGFILPKKFNVDKRKVHLSTLIMNEELERESALLLLSQSPYPDEADLRSDLKFFLDKLEWSKNDLDLYIERPQKDHSGFASSVGLQHLLFKIKKFIS